MKAVFTCDDVFEILTREPFPSGAADDEIAERHLAVCHECRQLAEAFRPAVGLFHEALTCESNEDLPSYRGRLLPVIDSLPQPVFQAAQVTRSGMLYLVAIVASLLLVGSIVLAAVATSPSGDSAGVVATVIRQHADRDYTLLAALEIPRDCRSFATSSEMATGSDFVCCTVCHNATSRVPSTDAAILKSSASCVACHDRLVDNALSQTTPHISQPSGSMLAFSSCFNL